MGPVWKQRNRSVTSAADNQAFRTSSSESWPGVAASFETVLVKSRKRKAASCQSAANTRRAISRSIPSFEKGAGGAGCAQPRCPGITAKPSASINTRNDFRKSIRITSKRFEEGYQVISLRFRQRSEFLARGFGFAAVPKDRFTKIARPAIVKEKRMAVDFADEADSPKRGSAPVPATGFENGTTVSQPFTHVVQR